MQPKIPKLAIESAPIFVPFKSDGSFPQVNYINTVELGFFMHSFLGSKNYVKLSIVQFLSFLHKFSNTFFQSLV